MQGRKTMHSKTGKIKLGIQAGLSRAREVEQKIARQGSRVEQGREAGKAGKNKACR
jgi:hypothetical protein